MEIIALSDMHGEFYNIKIEDCDVIVVAGDSELRNEIQSMDFLNWISKQPSKYKVVVAGNHCFFPYNNNAIFRRMALDKNVIYLEERRSIRWHYAGVLSISQKGVTIFLQ